MQRGDAGGAGSGAADELCRLARARRYDDRRAAGVDLGIVGREKVVAGLVRLGSQAITLRRCWASGRPERRLCR